MIINKALRFLFPERCPCCGKIIEFTERNCPECRKTEIGISSCFCHSCGYDADKCICSSSNLSFSHIAGIYIYSGLTKARIHELKFRNNKGIAKILGDELAFRASECFYEANFDCVTFVPISKKAYKERGYNQSELLAKQVAKRLFIPCLPLLEKRIETKKQHELGVKQRLENIKNSFAFKGDEDIKGKNVLLCDDVKTTGATLKECEKTLLEAGAKEVYCICIALSDYGEIFPLLDKKKETY